MVGSGEVLHGLVENCTVMWVFEVCMTEAGGCASCWCFIRRGSVVFPTSCTAAQLHATVLIASLCWCGVAPATGAICKQHALCGCSTAVCLQSQPVYSAT